MLVTVLFLAQSLTCYVIITSHEVSVPLCLICTMRAIALPSHTVECWSSDKRHLHEDILNELFMLFVVLVVAG